MKRPLTPADLYLLVTASDPRCAPGGAVYYVRTSYDEPADASVSAIWRTAPGVAPAPFTAGAKDRMPRVSPDGASLGFVGERDGKTRVYVMPTGGGEARAVTPPYASFGALEWAPGGDALAYTATAPHDPAVAGVALDARSGARHIRRLPFKSDDLGLLDGTRRHLFVAALDGSEPRQITAGDFDVDAPSWAPAGDRIAFGAQIGIPEWAFCTDIFVVARDGGELRKLTATKGPAATPAFSHDGAWIAYAGHEHGDDASGRFDVELLVVAANGGPVRSLSAAANRSIGDWVVCDTRGLGGGGVPAWSADDREIVVQLSDAGTCALVAFDVATGAHREISGGRRDHNAFSLGPDGTVAFVYSDPLVPSDVATIEPGGAEVPLTRLNPWLDERAIAAPRALVATAADGTKLDLWVIDAAGDGPKPLVLQVHGGPHTAYGDAFFFEFQVLASHGMSVAYGNPRGSQSYGSAFSGAITGDWGGVDVEDVLAILDAAAASGHYDPARIGLAGGSYGGFMTTLLLGRSNRFAAGVSMRAVNDFVSEAGASDVGWFLERELDAPWEADAGRRMFDLSPMRTAHLTDAPLLIEHSERDYRCPIDQGEQLFTLLRRLGKTVEFVRFTGDGHNLARTGKPRNRVLRLRAIAHWLVRHLRPAGVEPQPDAAGALFEPLPSERP